MEIEFTANNFKGTEEECLAKISVLLCKKINEKLARTDDRLEASKLFPDSIPGMIYNAYNYFNFFNQANDVFNN